MGIFDARKTTKPSDLATPIQRTEATSTEPTLEELEAVVATGLESFAAAGRALAEIKDRKLYQENGGTWARYLETRWHLTPDYAAKLITAAVIAMELVEHGLPAPLRESHARELSRVPTAHQPEVWQESLAEVNNDPAAVTAELIADKATKHRKPKARRKAPKAIKLKGKGWSIVITRSTTDLDPLALLDLAAEQIRTKANNRAA
jgi:hypothetical protein